MLLLAAHWLLFAAYVRREIAWAYAPNFDQTSGLFIAYRTWEDVLQHGLATGLADALRRSPPNGATLHLEAVLVFLLTGPSRLASLAVNWLHFALLQGALVWALWATTRRWELPALGLGLLLSMQMPFYWAGGIADFRPDFIAFCLYGTFLAVVWRSELFRRRAWSIVAGAVGALCVVSRSLTTVYLGGLLGLSLAVWAIRWWRERDPFGARTCGRQLTGAALCAACVGLVAFPALALRARSLWDLLRRGSRDRPGEHRSGPSCSRVPPSPVAFSSIPAPRSSIMEERCSSPSRSGRSWPSGSGASWRASPGTAARRRRAWDGSWPRACCCRSRS